MTEAKEKKQVAFESGWAVSFDEVCFLDVKAHNDRRLQKLVAQRNKSSVRGHIRVKVPPAGISCEALTDVSCLPPAVLHRKSHNRPMKMTVVFLSWRYKHAFQV